jgi:WhiB family redox-sensing transcriptional regulator
MTARRLWLLGLLGLFDHQVSPPRAAELGSQTQYQTARFTAATQVISQQSHTQSSGADDTGGAVNATNRLSVPGWYGEIEMGGDVDTEWMVRGKCRDMDPAVFFPNDGIGVQTAQRICVECPVKVACLEYALANRVDHGVWGGASERERRRVLRQRRLSRLQGSRN